MTAPRAYILHTPTVAPVALMLDSPHSGMTLPADFVAAAPRAAILSTWDAFVDELWADAPAAGATLLAANFPRAYVDVNRAEDDIDPDLLAEPWPTPLAPTAYTRRGMGLIRRNALPDVPMYDRRLSVAEVEYRISTCYRPYRDALRQQLDALHARFGAVWHLDCHSMKSRGNAMNVDAGATRPDVVIGDRQGTTADPAHTAWVAEWFHARGHSVQVNDPYQGGDIVARSGAPARGRHSIQIEINRALYMDETTVTRGARFGQMQTTCSAFLQDLTVHIASLRAADAR
jgi:N-formylglutamate deformylase